MSFDSIDASISSRMIFGVFRLARRNSGRFLFGFLFLNSAMWGPTVFSQSQPDGPEWAGGQNTTHQRDIFPDNGQLRMSEDFQQDDNEYGDSVLQITVGQDGEGWQDPSGTGVTRDSNGGAWDLGLDGDMSWTIPFAPTLGPGESYNLDYFVNVVFEVNLFDEPEFSIPGQSIDPDVSVTSGFDPGGPSSTWEVKTWSGTLSGVETNVLTFVAEAAGEVGSLVDTYDVYTQYTLVPEPGTYAACAGLMGLGLALLCRRRRLRS